MFTAMNNFLFLVGRAFYHYDAEMAWVGKDNVAECIYRYFGLIDPPLPVEDWKDLAYMFDTQLGKDIQYGVEKIYFTGGAIHKDWMSQYV